MPPFSRLFSVEKEYRPVLMVGSGGFTFLVGYGAIWFVLPIFLENMVHDLSLVGLLIAIPYTIAMLFDVPFGGLSDHLGRKKFFLTGFILMALLGLMLPTVDSIAKFILFAVLLGFGNICIVVPLRAYIMDIAPKDKYSAFFGVFEVCTQLGIAVGPIIAGYMIAGSLGVGVQNTGMFYFLASIASASILFTLKESVPDRKTFVEGIKAAIEKDKLYLRSLKEYGQLQRSGAAILLTTFIIVFIDGLVWTFEPLYTKLGIDAETTGLILSMFIIPFILFEYPAGLLADKIGKTRIFMLGLIIASLFLILFGTTTDPTNLIIYAFLATTGLALARPAMDGLLTEISEGKQRGGIAGTWNVAEDTAYFISPLVGGVVAEIYGISAVFIAVGSALLILTPLIYVAIRKTTP